MGHYPAFICQNGHPISTSSNSCGDKFCSKCGAPISNKCPSCNNLIRGKSDETYGALANYIVPAYCRHCGKPFPWTSAAIEATIYMLEEETNLSAEDRNKLIEVLPDVVAETPKTRLAAVRIQKAMATAGTFVAEGLRQFAIDFGCEFLKKQIGLK